MSDETTGRPEFRPRLGRGLAALLGAASQNNENSDASDDSTLQRAPIEFLRPNPRNPRRNFDDAALSELAESIKERGVIQPILVRPFPGVPDAYEIVAGERRWRAAQSAGQHDVPIIVMHVNDREALELAIVENIQRADLNPLEEAAGFAQLSAEYGYSHAEIARIIGKSRSHVANTLRLMSLPEHARDLLSMGKISAGHARALLPLDNPDAIADRIVTRGLTVRDVERLNARPEQRPTPFQPDSPPIDADTAELEKRLALALGTSVRIRHARGVGELRITFRDIEQLNVLCEKLVDRI